MVWLRITVKTIPEAEDIIVAECYEHGLEGAQIEDDIPLSAADKEQMFIDILPENISMNGLAAVSFFLEPVEGDSDIPRYLFEDEELPVEEIEIKMKEILEEIHQYADIGPGTLDISLTEDIDWAMNWKQFFHQFAVGGMLVLPSWEEPEGRYEGLPILHIDPGAAFGTGAHETTRICIQEMEKHLEPGDRILDVGTGSGILSIYALLNGASHAVATDLDPLAIETAGDNLAINGKKPGAGGEKDCDCELILGNIGEEDLSLIPGSFRMAVANILAEALVILTPHIVPFIEKGGILITSGILKGKEDVVKKAFEEAGLEVTETVYDGEWAGVTGVKR